MGPVLRLRRRSPAGVPPSEARERGRRPLTRRSGSRGITRPCRRASPVSAGGRSWRPSRSSSRSRPCSVVALRGSAGTARNPPEPAAKLPALSKAWSADLAPGSKPLPIDTLDSTPQGELRTWTVGDTLVMLGARRVTAYDAGTGERRWTLRRVGHEAGLRRLPRPQPRRPRRTGPRLRARLPGRGAGRHRDRQAPLAPRPGPALVAHGQRRRPLCRRPHGRGAAGLPRLPPLRRAHGATRGGDAGAHPTGKGARR